MKKYIFLTLFVFLGTSAYASGLDCDEEKTSYNRSHAHCYDDTDTDTDTDTQRTIKKNHDYGVGADVVLWKNKKKGSLLDEFLSEYRYDFRDKEHKLYGVVRINLWEKLKGKKENEDIRQ